MIKITYKNASHRAFLQELLKKNNFDADLKYQLSSEDQEDILKNYKGPAIGSPIPDVFIDLGQHIITFVLSEEFPIWISKKAITDIFFIKVIVPTYKKIFNNSPKNKEFPRSMCIITDEYEFSNHNKSIYFMLEGGLNHNQLNEALNSITDVRKAIKQALEVFDFSSDVLRFTYMKNHIDRDKWILQKSLDLSIDYYRDDSITSQTVTDLVKNIPKQHPSIFRKLISVFKR